MRFEFELFGLNSKNCSNEVQKTTKVHNQTIQLFIIYLLFKFIATLLNLDKLYGVNKRAINQKLLAEQGHDITNTIKLRGVGCGLNMLKSDLFRLPPYRKTFFFPFRKENLQVLKRPQKYMPKYISRRKLLPIFLLKSSPWIFKLFLPWRNSFREKFWFP